VRPLGEDFVKPVGDGQIEPERAAWNKRMEERKAKGKPVIAAKSLMEAGPWQRIWFMIAGAVFNFVAAFIILAVAALVGQPGDAVLVLDAPPGSPAAQAGLQRDDLILAVDSKPVKKVEDAPSVLRMTMDEDGAVAAELTDKPVALTVQRNGQTLDITVQPGEKRFDGVGVWVDSLAPGSPAEAVLKYGDIIVKADSTAARSTNTFRDYIKAHAGKTVTLTVLRDGKELKLEVVPRTNPPADQGALGVTIIPALYNPSYGFATADSRRGAFERLPLNRAIGDAAQRTVALFQQIAYAPIAILRGELRGDEGRIISPVGIAQVSSEVLQVSSRTQSPAVALQFIAVISIALGVTNLLPIPGLDGGRILFVIIELIRGKPMNPEREGFVHMIGLMLLLGLVAVLVVNDIVNPIGPIFR
jgi:regulator of sigma E protease